jgi:hypothetical protein
VAARDQRLHAAWKQLQQERADVFGSLDERHVQYITNQSREEQLQVCICYLLQ